VLSLFALILHRGAPASRRQAKKEASDTFRDSFLTLKRQAAPGVDGLTWAQYEYNLEERIVDLHQRVWPSPGR
jgi:hypothetical protein